MELESGKVPEPHERGHVLTQAVIHVAVVASAPDGGCLNPRRTVLRAVLLVEELGVDTVGRCRARSEYTFTVVLY